MDLDLNALIALISKLSPTSGAIAVVVFWLVQRSASGAGLGIGKGGLLDLLGRLLGNKPAAPVPAKPADPLPIPDEDVDGVPDERETLLDILVRRIRERLRIKSLAEDETIDPEAVIAEYRRIVTALDKPAVKRSFDDPLA